MEYFAEKLLELLKERMEEEPAGALLAELIEINGGRYHMLCVQEGPISPALPQVSPTVSFYSMQSATSGTEEDIDHIKLLCDTGIKPSGEHLAAALEMLNLLNRTLRFGCFYLAEDGGVYYEQDIALYLPQNPVETLENLMMNYHTFRLMLNTAYLPLLQCCNGFFTPADAQEMLRVVIAATVSAVGDTPDANHS